MKTTKLAALLMLALITVFNVSIMAHGDDDKEVKLNVDENWSVCAIDFHTSLTQSEFDRFVREVTAINYFNPMTSAKSLGQYKFDILFGASYSPIDQYSGAWNNTFHHPDEEHYLGDAVVLPSISVNMGITDRADVGAFFNKGINFTFLGTSLKYHLMQHEKTGIDLAVRGAVTYIAGIEDMNAFAYGGDVLASRTFWKFTPYVGLSAAAGHAWETTDEVDLTAKHTFYPRALAGFDFRLPYFVIGAEANLSVINTYQVKLGTTF